MNVTDMVKVAVISMFMMASAGGAYVAAQKVHEQEASVRAESARAHSAPEEGDQVLPASQESAAQETKTRSVIDILKQTADQKGSIFYLLILAFFAGLMTSFTPCVYPMIPITVSVLQMQSAVSLKRNFLSALVYVLGLSTVYASLGYFAATASVLFGNWVANPWVLLLIVIFFLYMAFSLFGFYEMYVPRFFSVNTDVRPQGSLAKIFLFGMISGTFASPCITPALAVLLTIVAKLGSPIAGFLILFLFSIGMGIVLVLIGTFSGALALLPRSGEWMIEVKRVMGFGMLGACVYFLTGFLGDFGASLAYGLILLAAGIYFVVSASRNRFKLVIGLLTSLGALAWLGYVLKGFFVR
ncbi:sulfite exporter TauE/SafE family protein [Candidatus Babeliales bacterium]|nr:sulfite exporter TauE/SafE family protein [Candidatus Babeliales bacterium]